MNPEAMLQLDSFEKVAAWVGAWTLAASWPAVGWLLFARSACWRLRGVALLTSVSGGLWFACADERYGHPLLTFALALVWFWLLSRFVRLIAGSPIPSRCALLCGSAAACVLLPRLLASDEALALITPFSVEVMLSAYSYLVEAQRAPNASRDDAAFFLLVNPALVRTRAGMGYAIGTPGLSWKGGLRILLGSTAMAGSVLAARSYAFVVEDVLPEVALSTRVHSAASIATLIVATALAAYWGHSGAMSVRIGWMHMLGWRTPERYNWPFLARSPLDFWRRWNIHWGAWLHRYVFDEVVRGIGRGRRRRRSNLPFALAVLATFLVSGVLHDLAGYVDSFDLSMVSTLGFAICAFGLLAWHALGLEKRLAQSAGHRRVLLSLCGGALALLLVGNLEWLRSQPGLPAWLSEPLGLAKLGF